MQTLAYAWDGPAARGRLRAAPEDFQVEEVLGFEPDGTGEHAWLWVRKRDTNTADVAQALAQSAGVPQRAVGFSGRKDRHALTWQWFSLQLPGRDDLDWTAAGDDRWRVERAVRHTRKLRVGTHRHNRFRLRVSALDGDRAEVDARLRQIAADGFPNYFGEQRFGVQGRNLERARTELLRKRRRPSAMLLSAARGWLFNRVLHERLRDGSWCTPQPGDALMLAGTRSLFECRGDEDDLAARIARFDVDVTGPLWGVGETPVGATVAAREDEWLASEAELRFGLERQGVSAGRRRLRAAASGLDWQWDDDGLVLTFTLPAGVYATSLLREAIDWNAAA